MFVQSNKKITRIRKHVYRKPKLIMKQTKNSIPSKTTHIPNTRRSLSTKPTMELPYCIDYAKSPF